MLHGSFLKSGDPSIDPKCCNPCCGDPQRFTPNFGNPHTPQSQQGTSWPALKRTAVLVRFVWGSMWAKIWANFPGVSILRIILLWSLYWGSPIYANYHVGFGEGNLTLEARSECACP